MRHKKLTFVLLGILSAAPMTQAQPDDLQMESKSQSDSSICETDPTCGDGSWDQAPSSKNVAYGYAKIGLGYSNLGGNYNETENKNTAPEFLGNPPIPSLLNPNYGDGATLSTDTTSMKSSSALGSFEFGYNAPLGQTRALLGFFAGINIMNFNANIPVTRTYTDYDVNYEESPVVLQNETEKTSNYESKVRSNLSFNAGISAGFRVSDSVVALLKGGWICTRFTSSMQQDQVKDKKNKNQFSPCYINGFMYGGSIDVSVTERTSIGLEAFGVVYADKQMALFNFESNPGAEINNTSTALGTVPSNEKLIANPLSATSWGIMATFKINFLER